MVIHDALKALSARPCILLCNYGDESIALIQWWQEQLTHLPFVVSIETGFSANQAIWTQRVLQGQQFAESLGMQVVSLNSKISFAEAVLGRNAFPCAKFQWCATLLKGLPLLDWLDEIDPGCRAVILLAKRLAALPPSQQGIAEWIEKSEHFNDRSVWHPLLEITDPEKEALLKRAGFTPLGHRSLECDPCVNSSCKTLSGLDEKDIQKVKNLEEAVKNPMFSAEESETSKNIEALVESAKSKGSLCKDQLLSEELSLFYRGCGNPFGCGL